MFDGKSISACIKSIFASTLLLGTSATLTFALLIFYLHSGDRFANTNVEFFNHENLMLVTGRGENDGSVIRIDALDASNDTAFVSSAAIRLPAKDFNALEWRIEGLSPSVVARLVWATRRRPKELQQIVLPHKGDAVGYLALGDVPAWRGLIGAIGLKFEGQPEHHLTLHELKLKTAAPGPAEMLNQVLSDWSEVEAWTDTSINFLVGERRDAVVSLNIVVAAWVLISAVLYLGLRLVRGRPVKLTIIVSIFVAGWLLLDARWQWALWRQHLATHEQFAGKSLHEKHLAGKDGELFAFAQELKQHLPATPARLLIISFSPKGKTAFDRLRLHYHLLPHNSYSEIGYHDDKLFSLRQLMHHPKIDGVYMLLLQPVTNMRYHLQERTLTWNDEFSISANLIFQHPVGLLFLVEA